MCVSLSLFFFFFFATITPARAALMLPAGCGKRNRCVIAPDRDQDSVHVPQSSLGLQQAQCWSLAALSGMTDMSLWVFKAPLKTGIKLMFWQTNWRDICNSTASIFNYALTKYRAVGAVFDISCLSRLIFRIVISCERKRILYMLPQAFSYGSNWFQVENNSRIQSDCVIEFNYISFYWGVSPVRQTPEKHIFMTMKWCDG